MQQKIVISLGGSMVAGDEINVEFLKKFKKFIEKDSSERTFYIIVGGGKTARKYQTAYREFKLKETRDLDMIGIRATCLNAELFRSVLAGIAIGDVFTDPNKLPFPSKPVVVGAGWKPGWSTDYVSVSVALKIGVKTVINLSNTDYIYDKDPKKHADAKPIINIKWGDYLKLSGTIWTPGLSLPFDPIASKLAQKNKITVVCLNGGKLANLSNYLCRKKFRGSIIG